jgi:hypothetical protein
VNEVREGKVSLENALANSKLGHIHRLLEDWRNSMQMYGTAKLWLQYQRMVAILRTFIRSVRIGSWNLYLQSLRDMHPYLAAAGHNNYTKSLALFIPKMLALETSHPDVHAAFMNGLFPVRRSDGAWSGIFTDLFIEQVLMAGIKSTGGLTRGRGFSESTRLLFLLSRPMCSEVSQSVFEIAGVDTNAEDGHRDLAASQIKRDMSDIQKLLQVFVERGPYEKTTKNLVSLSTGLVAEESVNASDAKNVGEKILASMVGKSVAEYKFSQKNQIKTLASALYVKVSTGEKIEMDPQRLYQRLVVMGINDIPINDLFQYELCSYPPSLFDTCMQMRTGDKAEIKHHLLKLVPASIVLSMDAMGLQFVVDGGGLLHKFSWPKHSSYEEICNMYVQHVKSSYRHALVVFDGYHGHSTKDEAHGRRAGHDIGATVSVSAEMHLSMSKKAFLANDKNKQSLIYLLAEYMENASISVEHAQGDADYKICKLACLSALKKPTAVVAEDTDVLQLLVHHADSTEQSEQLYMVTGKQTICITELKKNLDPVLVESLLFLHAISGCDTTSRPYGIGKSTVLTKYNTLQHSATTFMSPLSSKQDIEKAGEEALLVIYGCTSSPNLNAARVVKFQLKVATSAGYVSPEKLPPTCDAAVFHSLRTYHQVQEWRGNSTNPVDWGWVKSGSGLVPIRMEKAAAPESLIKIIRCNCGGNCKKKTCTCRKNGINCTPACGNCKGITCSNTNITSETLEDDDVTENN